MSKRNRQTTLRVSDRELRDLQALAKHNGMTVSDLIRALVAREARRVL